MDFFLAAVNRIGRALPEADHAGPALTRVNMVRDQFLAGQGRALLFLDVGFVLISEIAHRA